MVRRGIAAALCVAALLLSGCSDDPPEPKPLDPPTESETATAPPTSEPPKGDAPEDVIRTWFRTSYEMEKSGDTAGYRSLARDCTPCAGLADHVEEIYDAGGWVEPALPHIRSIKLKERRADGRRVYYAVFDARPWSVKESAAAKAVKKKGGRGTYRIEVDRVDGTWLITDYKVVVDGQDS